MKGAGLYATLGSESTVPIPAPGTRRLNAPRPWGKVARVNVYVASHVPSIQSGYRVGGLRAQGVDLPAEAASVDVPYRMFA